MESAGVVVIVGRANRPFAVEAIARDERGGGGIHALTVRPHSFLGRRGALFCTIAILISRHPFIHKTDKIDGTIQSRLGGKQPKRLSTLGESISGNSTLQLSFSGSTVRPSASSTSGYHALSSLPTSPYGARTFLITVNRSSSYRGMGLWWESGIVESLFLFVYDACSIQKAKIQLFL